MGTSSDSATIVGSIDETVPTDSGADGKRANGAAEIRQVKTALKTTFANVTGAVTASHTELNYLDGVTGRSGSDTTLITGTAGDSGDLVVWDANGDAVEGTPLSNVVTLDDTQTLTNKTLTSLNASAVTVGPSGNGEGGQISLQNVAGTSTVWNFDIDSGNNGRLFSLDGDSNFSLGQYAAGTGTITLTTNNNVRMTIAAGGNVGVGETSPDYKLDVNGSFGFTPGTSVTPADNGDVVIELTNDTTLTFKAKGSDGTVRTRTLTLA